MDFFSAAVTLFLIMDPLGNMPVFISILKHLPAKRRRAILVRELCLALLIMLMFLFGGDTILHFMGLKQESVSIAGGIILFLIAIKMIFPSPGGLTGLAVGEEPFLVPMAIPLMAGPSILASLILMSNQVPNHLGLLTLALVGAWVVNAAILLCSEVLMKLLGERGLAAMERLMGMILVMISVQMFLNGIGHYFKL
ncbi:YhgN family NAAT transporter [Gallaecimonas mangrovi]|uniref:YhgN family NAAT transporter n=1 Tax=Gallaecimonas mangrovi TaxID=2291597 RepID=UPI000E20082A|nr:YhgN family NAAT transporter [Gallaecimonas mangrovi]